MSRFEGKRVEETRIGCNKRGEETRRGRTREEKGKLGKEPRGEDTRRERKGDEEKKGGEKRE